MSDDDDDNNIPLMMRGSGGGAGSVATGGGRNEIGIINNQDVERVRRQQFLQLVRFCGTKGIL